MIDVDNLGCFALTPVLYCSYKLANALPGKWEAGLK